MSKNSLRKIFLIGFAAVLLFSWGASAMASPWTEKSGYFSKTGGKFLFGLKHSLFSWMFFWSEANEPQYKKEWEGACVGIGKGVVYTASGLIQLATFPIPVDFPDIGIGLHSPNSNCPARHFGGSRKTEEAKTEIIPKTAAENVPTTLIISKSANEQMDAALKAQELATEEEETQGAAEEDVSVQPAIVPAVKPAIASPGPIVKSSPSESEIKKPIIPALSAAQEEKKKTSVYPVKKSAGSFEAKSAPPSEVLKPKVPKASVTAPVTLTEEEEFASETGEAQLTEPKDEAPPIVTEDGVHAEEPVVKPKSLVPARTEMGAAKKESKSKKPKKKNGNSDIESVNQRLQALVSKQGAAGGIAPPVDRRPKMNANLVKKISPPKVVSGTSPVTKRMRGVETPSLPAASAVDDSDDETSLGATTGGKKPQEEVSDPEFEAQFGEDDKDQF